MRVLVFGSTGQVAQELRRLAPDARFLSREDADFMNPEACAAQVRDADIVINAAAWTAVDKAEAEEDAATLVNGHTPAAIARVCADQDIPFLHVSTDYVFDGSGDMARLPTDPTGPLGAYGRSKLVGEDGVRDAGGPHVILRTSWVFSAHGANFVKTMLRLSETRDALNVVDDQIGGPTPAADIARTLLTIAARFHDGQGISGIYHFAGAPDASWADFAQEIFAQGGRTVAVTGIPTSAYPTPAVRPANSRMDCTSLEQDYGIARPDWRKGLSQVLQDLK